MHKPTTELLLIEPNKLVTVATMMWIKFYTTFFTHNVQINYTILQLYSDISESIEQLYNYDIYIWLQYVNTCYGVYIKIYTCIYII